MKKLLLFCFSLLFIAASSGASLNIHYCRGKVSAVSLSILPPPSCACGKKAPKKACCKTETKLVKMQEDARQPVFTNDHSFPQSLSLPLQPIKVADHFYAVDVSKYILETGPPGASAIPLFLRHRVFRL
ncbi:MAG: HYC_CC_PP family protein [Bacteroidota bacterium]|jgi:hypothetical protein